MLPEVDGVEFRPIRGFTGYCIGDDGSIWTCVRLGGNIHKGGRRVTTPTGKWRKMNPGTHKSGHKLACLYREGKQYGRWVHRLVLEAFVGPCPDGMETRHGRGGPADNSLGNISWDTRSENALDRYRYDESPRLLGELHPQAKLTQGEADTIRAALARGATGASLARMYGVGQSTISRIRKGICWGRTVETITPDRRK